MTTSESLFDLSATTPAGVPFPFSTFQGKVLLVVNTATQCGFTPQFEGLEKLHQKYQSQGLVVVGFPCDQFAHQEPLTDSDMVEVCRRNHGVTFPLMAKSHVNGKQTNEVYRFLKGKTKRLLGNDVSWNFTKFLVSPNGKTVQRFESKVTPAELASEIEAQLKLV